jgi:predicted RNase H-like HicB family nuclease
MIIRVQVQGNVQWQVRPAGNSWIGVCEPLQLTVQGDTYGDLMATISETLDAVLTDLMKSNELPRFLQSHGWALATPLPEKTKNVKFDVPFIPAMMGANGPAGIVHQ